MAPRVVNASAALLLLLLAVAAPPAAATSIPAALYVSLTTAIGTKPLKRVDNIPFIGDGMTGFQAMLLACATSPVNITFTYSVDPRYGVFVQEIDGLNGTKTSYWALSRNNVSSPVGIGALPLSAGDEIEWVYTATTRA